MKGLKDFIFKANRNSYASNNSEKIKEKDNSTTIVYKNGSWKSHDNYFGGEPYGGRQVVFYKNMPVWITVYYGYIYKNSGNIDDIYGFLTESLRHNSKEQPLRGPVKYIKDNFEYSYRQRGDITSFFGAELIKYKGKIIYRAWHLGGMVDCKK